ncbi:unnamed protein product, partial [Rodentolepis nana]|uniref:Transmembrane BAX inhibitor motif-containing protein 4 n=1 Tax=Rodentolepis nana TaxID=102285 RepID=A0A0R3T1R0_RODNA
FIRKIYSILSIQLLLTCFTGAETISPFLSDRFYLIYLLGSCRYEFYVLITLSLVVYYDVNTVLQALFITMAVTIGLTVYAMQTKRDFSPWASCLGCCLMALLVGGISNVFFGSPTIHLAISIFGSILFSFFLIYDTQIIMQHYSPEEYIVAAITLYLDILNLFLYILRILQSTASE